MTDILLSVPSDDPKLPSWVEVSAAQVTGTYLVPDPVHPGLYLMASGSSLTPDPDHTGLYTIGA